MKTQSFGQRLRSFVIGCWPWRDKGRRRGERGRGGGERGRRVGEGEKRGGEREKRGGERGRRGGDGEKRGGEREKTGGAREKTGVREKSVWMSGYILHRCKLIQLDSINVKAFNKTLDHPYPRMYTPTHPHM